MTRLIDSISNLPALITYDPDSLCYSPRGHHLFKTMGAETGAAAPFLYKEYSADGNTNHHIRLQAMVKYLHQCQPQPVGYLAGAPLQVVKRENADDYGVILRQLPGVPLREFAPLRHLSLPRRIDLAIDLATATSILHGHGIVHSDLTSANILVDVSDPSRPSLNLIDFDLAAIQDASGWMAGMNPVVEPGFNSPYIAPEQVGDDGSGPTLWTDRWCLAIALHHLLISPFYQVFFDTPLNLNQYSPASAIYTGPHLWPAPEKPGERDVVIRHRQQLNMLGVVLKRAFVETFSQIPMPQPQSRLSASAWLKLLVMSRAHAFVCTGNECLGKTYGFVSVEKWCPICGRPGTAAQH